MSDSDLAYLDTRTLVARYRDGSLSPVEVASALLQRIEKYDGPINAWCYLDEETTLAQARQSEERWRRHEPAGRLDGVPLAVKDIFFAKGWPTRKGSKLVDPHQGSTDDSPVVANVRRHGAVLLGKTTTPELGWKAVTDSPLTGVTRNPWNTHVTPGGSSGGSSAALAAGMAPLALGTDGGGSIRIPAAFTSTVGIKPTWGRVPHWPVSPYGALAHSGPMARTVADTALLLGVLAEFDPRDPAALIPDSVDYLANLEKGVAGLKIAYSPDLGYVDFVDHEIAGAVRKAAEAFEHLGASVEQRDPGFSDPIETFRLLWETGAAQSVGRLTPEELGRMDPALADAISRGSKPTAVEYLDANAARGAFGVSMSLFFQNYDLLITPAVPIPPFEAGRDVPADWTKPGGWPSWTPFSYPFNITQQPAVSVPCGFTSSRLPIGLQIVGPRGADATVLQAARAYEASHPVGARWPSLQD